MQLPEPPHGWLGNRGRRHPLVPAVSPEMRLLASQLDSQALILSAVAQDLEAAGLAAPRVRIMEGQTREIARQLRAGEELH